MERSILNGFSPRFGFCLAVALLSAPLTTARADAIPAYTVTDLGAGLAELSADADGYGVVIAPDGQRTYPFPHSDYRVSNLSSVLPLIPPLNNAPIYNPMTYGNPNNAYSQVDGGFLNQNGLFVGNNVYGVAGHVAGAGSVVYTSQRQVDGTFGPVTTLWGSPTNHSTGDQVSAAMFVNNRNQILGVSGIPYSPNSYNAKDFYLFDADTNTRTDLKTLLPEWQLLNELGLDEQGRILLYAHRWDQQEGDQYHSLLLTPTNLFPDPTRVPEPTTLATLTLGMSYLASRRSSRRRAASGSR